MKSLETENYIDRGSPYIPMPKGRGISVKLVSTGKLTMYSEEILVPENRVFVLKRVPYHSLSMAEVTSGEIYYGFGWASGKEVYFPQDIPVGTKYHCCYVGEVEEGKK